MVRVLVIEDETRMARVVKRALEEEGHAVDLASNGTDGVWLATEHVYGAVVLDVMLPDSTGSRPAGACGRRTCGPRSSC